jgi:hypothetical protein
MFNIIDTQDRSVVATRKTLASAKKWAVGLNEGFKVARYVVSKAA